MRHAGTKAIDWLPGVAVLCGEADVVKNPAESGDDSAGERRWFGFKAIGERCQQLSRIIVSAADQEQRDCPLPGPLLGREPFNDHAAFPSVCKFSDGLPECCGGLIDVGHDHTPDTEMQMSLAPEGNPDTTEVPA